MITTWRSLLEQEKRIRGDETPLVAIEWGKHEFDSYGAEPSLDAK